MCSQIRPCWRLELLAQAGSILQPTQGMTSPNAGTVGPDEILCVLSLLLCHALLQHERTAHADSACGQFICKSRAHATHRTHVDAFHSNMIWTAGIHVVAELVAPAALVGPYGLCDQSYGHGFEWESVFELGE